MGERCSFVTCLVAVLAVTGCADKPAFSGATPDFASKSVDRPNGTVPFSMTPHFASFTAPEPLIGSIKIGKDGVVEMNGRSSYVHFNSGTFTRTAYNIHPAQNVTGQGDINALTVGPPANSHGAIYTILRHSPFGVEPFSTVGRYDVVSGAVAESAPLTLLGDQLLVSLAHAGDGNVWVTGSEPAPLGQMGFAFVVSPALNQLMTGLAAPYNDPLDAITYAPDGGMYVATIAGPNPPGPAIRSRIFRIDSHTYARTATCKLPANSFVAAMTGGPDSRVWFTDTGLNEIGRVDAKCTLTYFNVPTASAGLSGITSAPDNALYFSEKNANKIGRITTAGVVTEYAIPAPGTQPQGIVAARAKVPPVLFFVENGELGRLSFTP